MQSSVIILTLSGLKPGVTGVNDCQAFRIWATIKRTVLHLEKENLSPCPRNKVTVKVRWLSVIICLLVHMTYPSGLSFCMSVSITYPSGYQCLTDPLSVSVSVTNPSVCQCVCYQSLCLSVCLLPIHLSVSVSVANLSACQCVCYQSLCLSVCLLPIPLSVCHCVCYQSLCLSVCLLPIPLSVGVSVTNPSVCLSVCLLSIPLSLSVSVTNPSVCQCVCGPVRRPCRAYPPLASVCVWPTDDLPALLHRTPPAQRTAVATAATEPAR